MFTTARTVRGTDVTPAGRLRFDALARYLQDAAEDDLADIAEEMEPGSAAGVIVWENTWAAPFAVAVRRNGGQLISSGRIPTQALIAAIGSDDDE